MLENRVRDVTTSIGTGSVALANTPPTGCLSFSGAGIPSGSTVRYEINDGAGNWEIWTGVFTTGPDTLTKAVLELSSSGSQISWAAGSKSVFITPSARDLVYQLPSWIGTTAGTANAQTISPATKLSAYRQGYFFRVTIGGGTNTGPTTLNISSIGPRNWKKIGPGGKVALEGGELVNGQTYENVDDGTDILVLNPSTPTPPGCGRLSRVSSTSLKFAPYNGDLVRVNGILRRIPSAGISGANTSVYVNGVAGQNLAASTAYLVTLFDNAGTLTFDFKTTLTHAPSTTVGNIGTEIWNADDTRSVIGMIYTNASSQFDDSAALRNVASWFNRQVKPILGTVINANIGSGSLVELSSGGRVEATMWAEGPPFLTMTGNVISANTDTVSGGIYRDGTANLILPRVFVQIIPIAGNSAAVGVSNVDSGASEGRHYWTMAAQGSSNNPAVNTGLGGSVFN